MSKHGSRDTSDGKVKRQSLTNRTVHWLVALSTFALFFSGFGQMPMYQRYGVSSIPGLEWSADFHLTLSIHYVAGAVLFFAVVLHVVYALMSRQYDIMPRRGDLKESAQIIGAMFGFGEEPDSHKYLAEQRVAYAFIGGTLLVLVATGLVKVLKNLHGVDVWQGVLFVSTAAHNVAAMLLLLGIVGHFVAFAFKANRALLPAMFHGHVDAEYAKERHGLWYQELAAVPQRADLPAAAESDRM